MIARKELQPIPTALFRRVDADGDGGLSLEEFRSMGKLTVRAALGRLSALSVFL
jgi:hypothetical protein